MAHRSQEDTLLHLQVYYKDTNEHPDEEEYRAKSRRVLSSEASFPMELECATLSLCNASINLEAQQISLFKKFYRP